MFLNQYKVPPKVVPFTRFSNILTKCKCLLVSVLHGGLKLFKMKINICCSSLNYTLLLVVSFTFPLGLPDY